VPEKECYEQKQKQILKAKKKEGKQIEYVGRTKKEK
jgi:hypothetical protein